MLLLRLLSIECDMSVVDGDDDDDDDDVNISYCNFNYHFEPLNRYCNMNMNNNYLSLAT